MKLPVVFVGILTWIGLSASAQNANSAKLVVEMKDSRTNDQPFFFVKDSVHLIARKDGQLVSPLEGEFYVVKTFPSLEPGNYTIRYKNIFSQVVDKEIFLAVGQNLKVTLFTDSLLSYTNAPELNLPKKDTLTISFTTIGCFHNRAAKIIILPNGDHIYARLAKVLGRSNKKQGRRRKIIYRDSVLSTIKIDHPQFLAINRFLNELKFVQGGGGCTTGDTYVINTRVRKWRYDDDDCMWNGFAHLQEYLFGINLWP